MTSFIDENFLLDSDVSRQLYFNVARDLPIIDFHNHLPPEDVAADRHFANLTEAWLEDDHYKWRAMRSWGVGEVYCTGSAPAEDKFLQWAGVVPHTLGNPLYHWTHMELQQYFGIDTLLDEKSAADVYQTANQLLQQEAYSVRGLLRQSNAKLICTTDEPDSDLAHHERYAASGGDCTMLPTLRLDSLLAVRDTEDWNQTVESLGAAADIEILCLEDFFRVLEQRHDFFHARGCRLSDVGISEFMFCEPSQALAHKGFAQLRAGDELGSDEAAHLVSSILLHLSRLNARRGWVQQLHLGALRDSNRRKVNELGQGRGFDSIGGWDNTIALGNYLDCLNREGQLAKTILYNLNPADNAIFSVLAGSFNEGDVRGKVQHGAAWWFLDQKQGIEEHLMSVSSLGLLSTFVGMVTDSRSFLSFPRHDYFRRIVCNFLGQQAAQGLLPKDYELLGDVVRRVCYQNAREYLPFFND